MEELLNHFILQVQRQTQKFLANLAGNLLLWLITLNDEITACWRDEDFDSHNPTHITAYIYSPQEKFTLTQTLSLQANTSR